MKMKWKVVSPYTGIEEDAPASSAGGGNIAGIGVDHPDRPGSGEPGIDPKKKKKKHTLIDRNGKIDRKALPEPDEAGVTRDNEYVAPRNEHERILCDIFQSVLKLEQVSVHDDFFQRSVHLHGIARRNPDQNVARVAR